MGARKLIRENLGLSYYLISEICGTSMNMINTIENRGKIPPLNVDEIFQLYFKYGDKSGQLDLPGMNDLHLALSYDTVKKIDKKIIGLQSKADTYQMKYNNLENKYLQIIRAAKGIEYLKTIAVNGSKDLQDRINETEAIHKRKLTQALFKSLVRVKIQIEWIQGEIKALNEMKEYVI